jgi:DNA-binding CsgD family transcriptional regulator
LTKDADFIATIEAVYTVDRPAKEWLRGILESARGWLAPHAGLIAMTWSIDADGAASFADFVSVDGPPLETLVGAMGEGLRSTDRALVAERLRTVRAGFASAASLPKEVYDAYYGPLRPFGIVDRLNINGPDTDATGIWISANLTKSRVLGPRDVRLQERLTRHLVAGNRLRRRLAGRAPTDGDAAAILKPDGALEHATRAAATGGARAALRDAVLAMERARGAERRQDPEGAVRRWRVLADARYSLVDRFESDGRRYVVACENPPKARGAVTLTARERQVVALYRLGMDSKLIAYELGVADATIRVLLSRAAKRLGAKSPRALRG